MRTEPMVGRAGQVAAVAAMLDGVARGSVAACVFVGEPGAGKSVLWRHGLARGRERGYLVLSCSCDQPTDLPFAGLIELLDGTGDALGQLPDPQRRMLDAALLRADAGDRLLDVQTVAVAVLTLVRRLAETGPLLIGVDDVHNLDPATVGVLRYLARRMTHEPVGLLLTVTGRLAEQDPDPLSVSEAFDEEHLQLIHVGPLEATELHQVIQARTGLSPSRPNLLRLHRASGGNPFVALQFASALVTCPPPAGHPLPVPRHWRDLAAARLRALPEPARRLVLYAAALPEAGIDDIRAALAAAGPRTPGLADAERAGLVEIHNGQICFRHRLGGPAVYQAATGEQRRQAHLRLSRVVSQPQERARHLAMATDTPSTAVANAVEQAARRADAAGTLDVAADLWELAADRTPPTDTRRSTRMVAAARCLYWIGDPIRARTILQDAVSAAPPGSRWADALLWLATATADDEGPKAATALLREAVVWADGHPRVCALAHLRLAWFTDTDPQLRLTSAQTARAYADLAGATPPSTSASIVIEYFGLLAGHAVDLAALDKAAAALPTGDFNWEVQQARTAYLLVIGEVDPATARQQWQQRLRHAAETGDEAGRAQALYHLGEISWRLGHWTTAGRTAEELITLTGQNGQRRLRAMALYLRALVAAHRGDLASASTASAQGLKIAEQLDDAATAVLHLSVRGFSELSSDDTNAADMYLTQAAQRLTGTDVPPSVRFRLLGDLVEAELTAGLLRRADERATELSRQAADAGHAGSLATAARCRALVSMAAGDLPAAAQAITQAHQQLCGLPLPFDLARTHLVHGQILRRLRQRRTADQVLHQAEAAFSQLGAPLWAARASAERRRVGLRRTAEGQLTPAEAQVAGHVVAGRTNDEVATALRISRRTVENHLGRIYRKLGVRTRAELPAVLGPI